MRQEKVVVIFSGGQDSTTCLVHALKDYQEVHCITFDYQQRHKKEVEVAQKIAKDLGVKHHKIIKTMTLSQLNDNALTNSNTSIQAAKKEGGIPNTFVPGRNSYFITIAAMYAYEVQANILITGVCDTDFSNYPDCRSTFIKAQEKAINLAFDYPIKILTPLMKLTKAETWAMADKCNQLDYIKKNTLTCYEGQIGDGCQQCPACLLREEGYNTYLNNKQKLLVALSG
jgi:7-cyano-7-deazaguanine synthase